MASPVFPSSRLIPFGIVAAAAVLGVPALLASGDLWARLALAGGAVVLGVVAVLLSGLIDELHRLAAYARTLAEAEGADGAGEPAMPDLRTVPVRSLAADITRLNRGWHQRQAGDARRLRANEAVLEALYDPLILIDGTRRVVLANGAARAVFGDRMTDRDLAVSLRNPALLAAVDAVLAGAASKTAEFSLPVPVERVFEARIKPFRPEPFDAGADSGDDGGAADAGAAILTLHEITTIKRSEQMRADFVANVSHELRTPLASLQGFIETLRGPARDDAEARDRFLAIMHDQATRMARLVNDLLSLSRIQLDEHTPPTGRADLGQLARAMVATLELRATAKRVRLRLDAAGDLPSVQGDEDQLAQVLQNLMDNAIKYAREHTEVTVRLDLAEPGGIAGRRGGRMVRLAVTDRGEGIPRTHLPRLTERFYRVDTARSRALGGTGLGLAIVKHIVNRHRGRLTIESDVGTGSTFTVYLPAAEPAAEDETPAALRRAGSAA